ncbi:MAG: amino acid permease [Phycisphaeraceae bacterium]|nr:amino acid permease [Phycisphaeraceae bacterium]
MLVTQRRPRDLHWYHAGPLLFGDWGTSRLYVLGLAFFYAGHASLMYLAAISLLMIAVAWAYTVVCRCFPDGGGVYAAAKQVDPTLAVVGSTLLLCGYIITVVISLVEAFHYFGIGHGGIGGGTTVVLWLSVFAVLALGGVNWLGAKSAGTFAAVAAIVALAASGIIALLCLPYVPAGLSRFTLSTGHGPWMSWVVFTKICLAMAGVEAVANMAGLMKEPVGRTARRTIWPVAAEVVIFNLLFGVALAGLSGLAAKHVPDWSVYQASGGPIPADVQAYRDTGMKVLAIEAGSHWLGDSAGLAVGRGAAVVFGLLLISAANTAIMAMVSVLYSLGHDRELPRGLTTLNYPGVPWVALVVSCGVCIAVLVLERDVARLADMYVIGVCGAVTTNILCCAFNQRLEVSSRERAGLWALGLFLLAITLTITVSKPQATLFAGSTVGLVLISRWVVRLRARRLALAAPVVEPAHGWLEELRREIAPIDPAKPRIMLAARGRGQAEFAVDLARRRGATLFVMYVRTLRLMDVVPGAVPKVEDDPQALQSLGSVAALARSVRVPVVPIYVCATDVAAEILDYTVTFGCDTLVMGKTKRRAFARALEGDVITRVVQHLPSEVALITREDSPHLLTLAPTLDAATPPAPGADAQPTNGTPRPASPHPEPPASGAT